MRILALAIVTIGMEPAAAQTYDPAYPVCMHVFTGGFNYCDCSYTSLPQCRSSASGRAGQCDINPYYAGATGVTAAPIELTATYVREGGKMIHADGTPEISSRCAISIRSRPTKPPLLRCSASSTAMSATSHRCRACFQIIQPRWSASRAANAK